MNQSALEKAMTVRRWRFIPSHKWPVLRGVSVRKGWLGWDINVCRSAKINTERKRTDQAFRKPSLHRKTTKHLPLRIWYMCIDVLQSVGIKTL